MKHEIDLSKYSIRTDLIIENQNQFSDQENYQHDNIKVTSVKLSNEEASKINKKAGTYITIEFEDVTDQENQEKLIQIFTTYLKKLFGFLK